MSSGIQGQLQRYRSNTASEHQTLFRRTITHGRTHYLRGFGNINIKDEIVWGSAKRRLQIHLRSTLHLSSLRNGNKHQNAVWESYAQLVKKSPGFQVTSVAWSQKYATVPCSEPHKCTGSHSSEDSHSSPVRCDTVKCGRWVPKLRTNTQFLLSWRLRQSVVKKRWHPPTPGLHPHIPMLPHHAPAPPHLRAHRS